MECLHHSKEFARKKKIEAEFKRKGGSIEKVMEYEEKKEQQAQELAQHQKEVKE